MWWCTNAAQRVSSSRRFTLDSMPGQQMSIDADLKHGFIDQDEAKRRRKTLEREQRSTARWTARAIRQGRCDCPHRHHADQHRRGLVIGVLQQGMPWGQALRQYTLLTIGDESSLRFPRWSYSVGTGLIVTRSGFGRSAGCRGGRQLVRISADR